MNVGQHDVGAEELRGGALRGPAQRGQREVTSVEQRIGRDQPAVDEHLALAEVLLQPVADDQVGAEDQVALHVVGEAQPDHRRGD